MTEAKTVTIEDAQIIFRNFSGAEGQYNRPGDRNFVVIIPDEAIAQEMLADGWNIKYLDPREEGDAPTPTLSVAVNFKQRPPRVVMMTETSKTSLNEESVGLLDWADIISVDLIVRAYEWNVGDKTGTKAYLKSLFVKIQEDELERKYGINDVVAAGDNFNE